MQRSCATAGAVGAFQVVVGDPPSVVWSNLAASYRDAVKHVCDKYNIFADDARVVVLRDSSMACCHSVAASAASAAWRCCSAWACNATSVSFTTASYRTAASWPLSRW